MAAGRMRVGWPMNDVQPSVEVSRACGLQRTRRKHRQHKTAKHNNEEKDKTMKRMSCAGHMPAVQGRADGAARGA